MGSDACNSTSFYSSVNLGQPVVDILSALHMWAKQSYRQGLCSSNIFLQWIIIDLVVLKSTSYKPNKLYPQLFKYVWMKSTVMKPASSSFHVDCFQHFYVSLGPPGVLGNKVFIFYCACAADWSLSIQSEQKTWLKVRLLSANCFHICVGGCDAFGSVLVQANALRSALWDRQMKDAKKKTFFLNGYNLNDQS